MADLNPLTYGKVTGRFVAIIGDTGDALDYPDYAPLVGTVTIKPDFTYGLVPNALPVPTTILPQPFVITLNATGDIEWNGLSGIWLVATNDPNVNPTGFTYTATFDLSYNGTSVPYGPLSFQLPAGTTVDLTTVAPVASGGGVLTVAGPPGPSGSALPVASAAEAQAMSLTTKTITPLNLADASSSTATASRLVRRDAAGRTQFADPSAAADAATKNYVDTQLTGLGTSAATPSTLMKRDASGRAQVANPSAAADIATMGWVQGLTASQTQQGIVELATDPEGITATSTTLASTPSSVFAFFNANVVVTPTAGYGAAWNTNAILRTNIGSSATMLNGDYRLGDAIGGQGLSNDQMIVNVGAMRSAFGAPGLEEGKLQIVDNAVPTPHGFAIGTTAGTGTAVAATRTSASVGLRPARYEYRAAAATTAIGGIQLNVDMPRQIDTWVRWTAWPISGWTSTSRFFIGLQNATTLTDVNPSTLLSIVGVGYDSTDTNYQVMTNDGSGTAAKVDTGIAKPNSATNAQNQPVTVTITTVTNGFTVYLSAGTAGGVFETTVLSVDVPALSTAIKPTAWHSAGGTSTAAALAVGFFRYRMFHDIS